MKSLRVAMVASVLGGIAGCPAQSVQSPEGSWIIVSVQEETKEVPAADFKGDEISFADGKMTVKRRQTPDVLSYKLNAATMPPSMDFEGGFADGTIKKQLAIYEINGDEMKLCINRKTKDRPTAFQTDKEANLVLLTLKRKK